MGNKQATKLPAGEYLIGDPCQILSSEDYGVFLDNRERKIVPLRGREFAVIRMGHDGGYDFERDGDFQGCAIGVDSGCVAAVPAELARDDPGRLVVRTEFAKPFSCWRFARWACFGNARVSHC